MAAQKIIRLYHNLFNAKLAFISFVCNGILAIYINWSYGYEESLWAGLSQAISSFFSTGFTGRIVQHFSPIKSLAKSLALGSVIPAAFTFILSYAAHWWNETPELLASTIAPTLISFMTSFVTNILTRAGYLRPKNYPTEEN